MSQNPRNPIILEARHNTNLNGFVIFMVELGIHAQIVLSCKLQSKQATKQKVSMPKTQDLMTLIHELVKALNLYANIGAKFKSSSSRNSNPKFASKRVWMQKTQPQ